jgi:hypothetical protein
VAYQWEVKADVVVAAEVVVVLKTMEVAVEEVVVVAIMDVVLVEVMVIIVVFDVSQVTVDDMMMND